MERLSKGKGRHVSVMWKRSKGHTEPCGSVRCQDDPCKAAYARTVTALDVATLGEQEKAYVDVRIFMGGAYTDVSLTRSDVNCLMDHKWRAKCKTFHIPQGNGKWVVIVPSAIVMVEELSEDH